MASVGPVRFGTVTVQSDTSVASGYTNWDGTSKIIDSDTGTYNFAVMASSGDGPGVGETSNSLYLTNADLSAIPDGSTIDGFVTTLRFSSNNTRDVTESIVTLIIGGTPTGANKAANTAADSTPIDASHGGVADLWSTTPTDTQVKASNFGLQVQFANGSPSGTRQHRLYDATITVYYTESGGGGSETGSASFGATAGGAFSAVVNAQASASAAAAADSAQLALATANGSLSNGAQVSDVVSALARSLAAVIDGAQAGAAWVGLVSALGDMSAGAETADSYTGMTEGAQSASMTAGSSAGDVLSALAATRASVSMGAQSADASTVSATLRAVFSDGSQSSDTFAASAAALASLTDGASAGELYEAAAAALASFAAAASAASQMSYLQSIGYLNGIITLIAALNGAASLQSAIDGEVSADAAVDGVTSIRPIGE